MFKLHADAPPILIACCDTFENYFRFFRFAVFSDRLHFLNNQLHALCKPFLHLVVFHIFFSKNIANCESITRTNSHQGSLLLLLRVKTTSFKRRQKSHLYGTAVDFFCEKPSVETDIVMIMVPILNQPAVQFFQKKRSSWP